MNGGQTWGRLNGSITWLAISVTPGGGLWKTPGFTLLAVLTLAIGIGANTAIFSTINALLLRPVGSVNPDRLVGVGVNYDKLNIKSPTVSPTVFADVRDSKDIFEVAAMATSGDFNFNGSGLPERLQGQLVTWQWFDVFGARPILGRSFRPEEDQPNTNRVVVLDYRAWRSLFGGDVSIIGRSIQLNQEPYEVVGVMEPGFRRSNVLLWSPLGLPAEAFAPRNRFNESFETYARLKPGVSFEQAQAFVGVLNERVYENPRAAAFAKQNGWSMRLIRYTDYIAGDLKAPMFVLMGAVGFVFLIACSNIAGLMLARMSLRRREVAVQIAFGASRWQLIQQTLSEALFIMAGGSILGVGLAYAGIQALLALAPAAVSEGLVVTLDATVIAFLLLVSLIAGVLFGIAPAWHVSRTGTYESLKDGARGGTAGRAQLRLRSGLVMLEVALALLLLIGAGLFARSFARLQQVDIGFESAGVMSGFATLPQGPYKAADKQIAFYRAAIERLANLPGVSSAAAAIPLPFGGQAGGAFNIEGVPPEPNAPVPQGSVRWISPAFFSTIQIPIKRGRTFTDQDVPGSLPVVVIDEKLARQYWPNEDPIGKRIRRTISNASWLTIVGIVGSIRQSDLAVESTRGAYYLPMYQQPQPFLTTAFLVKTDSDPLQLSNPIREAVRSIDPAQPVANLKPMDEVVMATLGPRRFAVVLLTSFAAIALFMAALGLYAVIQLQRLAAAAGNGNPHGPGRAAERGLVAGDSAGYAHGVCRNAGRHCGRCCTGSGCNESTFSGEHVRPADTQSDVRPTVDCRVLRKLHSG
jgi:predicted permease